MTIYEKYRKLDLNLSLPGLAPNDAGGGYFCTPKGAKVIGWEGVDGIHYCFVKGFGETVFAVNPSNLPEECVHPLAETFEDFLRLLLACGGTAAIEQAWMWNRGEFNAFLETYPPNAEQRAVLETLRDKLALTPMEDPYGYIKKVQSSFDYKQIQYSKEYYDLVLHTPDTQEPPEHPAWKVYFENGFGRHRGHDKPGQEIPVNKTFLWDGRTWHIPAVYVCGKGLVMDFCVEIDPAAIRTFVEKWKPLWEGTRPLTPEEEEQQEGENPSRMDFKPKATVNGRKLRPSSGNGQGWIPTSLYRECGYNRQSPTAVWLMEHYGLNQELGWTFWRQSFPWATKTKPAVKTISLSLEQEHKAVPGIRFSVSGVGDAIPFIHPVTGETHTLQVVEYEKQEADLSRLESDWEYPTHYTAMSYVIEPELPKGELAVRDCGQGDRPRVKCSPAPETIGGADGPTTVCSIGIIGGIDGPTEIIFSNGKTGEPRSVCSALRFEQPKQIEWRIVFYQKTAEDMEIHLLLPENR